MTKERAEQIVEDYHSGAVDGDMYVRDALNFLKVPQETNDCDCNNCRAEWWMNRRPVPPEPPEMLEFDEVVS